MQDTMKLSTIANPVPDPEESITLRRRSADYFSDDEAEAEESIRMCDTMKLSTLAESTLDPDESIALRRRSTDRLRSRDDEQSLSDVSDLPGFGPDDAIVDGGREAWKTLFAAWIIDFMTSGELAHA